MKACSPLIGFAFAAIVLLSATYSAVSAAADIDCKNVPMTDQDYWQSLADAGNPQAQLKISETYYKTDYSGPLRLADVVMLSNIPGKLDGAKNYLFWVEKSAAQNYPPALTELAQFYQRNARDEASAAEQPAKAYRDEVAEHISQQVNLFYDGQGINSSLGTGGMKYPSKGRVQALFNRAMELYKKAAETGDTGAHYELAWCYSDAKECPVADAANYEEAYYWLLKLGARAHGDPARHREEFKSHLSADQIAAVEKRLADWKGSPLLPAQPPPMINLKGLACGGESSNCKVLDRCGAIFGFICPSPSQYYISDGDKILSQCGSGSSCKNFVPKEWTCGSPKNMPMTLADQEKYGGNAVLCGDILGVDHGSATDGPYYFLDKNSKKNLGTCNHWQGSCVPPKEWTCGRPSNYGG